ncbi:hypothetical protein RGE_19490 [Rubrivivax gelatinosus IL144]|uniref:Uncharacterized protein n=1 Tax=Rubrivivax gelatinosus (strain NBRC 100245 / IL144) TaxID=983917 RepID=I0HQK3_RUBGI|nr:hypothetical protein RGE_19490 [Rubrivivax gelatinosus IL144]
MIGVWPRSGSRAACRLAWFVSIGCEGRPAVKGLGVPRSPGGRFRSCPPARQAGPPPDTSLHRPPGARGRAVLGLFARGWRTSPRRRAVGLAADVGRHRIICNRRRFRRHFYACTAGRSATEISSATRA